MRYSSHRRHRSRSPHRRSTATPLVVALALLMLLGSLPAAAPEAMAAPSGTIPPTTMTGTGTYSVVASREGLVGQMTSSGHIIQPNDHFASLPACTTTSCAWLDPGELVERYGNRTECGDDCYVKVINPATQACQVVPVLDTGPWFTLDDWWNPTAERNINKLESNPNDLPQGVPAAAAARNGVDVGYGYGSGGIGASNRYSTVGNAAAIDVADGAWMELGLDFNKGIGTVDIELLWQTGADPASAASGCGHPLDQSGETSALTISPASGEVGTAVTVSGTGFTKGETVTIHGGSTATPAVATVTANSSGAISTTIRMPDAPLGNAPIIAVGGSSGTEQQATFRVTPSIERAPTQGSVGTPVQFSVHGYARNEDVRVTWDNADGALIATIRTNDTGAGSTTVTMPKRPAGWNTYYARGGTSKAGAYGAFNVLASSVTNPPGDASPSFGGNKLTPASSFGSSNGSGSTLVWDGDTRTSWQTVTSKPTSGGFTIDYGKVYDLTGVRWQMATTGEADSFLVETSIDGTRWAAIGTYGNAAVNAWFGEDLSRQGRYLRVTFGNPNSDARIGGISEIELWGSAVTGTPTGAPAGSNPTFSGQKLPIAGSATTRTDIPGANAYDGNSSTSWYTSGSDPLEASLTLDLGEAKQVSGAKWTFSKEGGADSLTVAVSADGQAWTTIGTSSNRRAGTWEGIAIDQPARYVRLIFTNPYNAEVLGYVAEVEVWGTGTTVPPTPESSSTPDPTPGATAPSTAYPGSNPSFGGNILPVSGASSSALPTGQQVSSASRAIDGDQGTSWYTTGGDPDRAILMLDLGEVRPVTGVKWLYNRSDGIDQQILQVSKDGSNWTQKVVTSARQPYQWEGFAVDQDARYVRLILTNAKNLPVLGYVAEVQVWGEGDPAPTATSTPKPTHRTPALHRNPKPSPTATSTPRPTAPHRHPPRSRRQQRPRRRNQRQLRSPHRLRRRRQNRHPHPRRSQRRPRRRRTCRTPLRP